MHHNKVGGMRFQVLSSTLKYSKPLTSSARGLTLGFNVFPCGLGELKFSDGNRLMGCKLPEDRSEPVTIGSLADGLKKLGHRDIDDKKFLPLPVTVTVTDADWKTGRFANEEYGCGHASYRNDDYRLGLDFWLSVGNEVFRDLLCCRLDEGGHIIFDIDVRGISEQDRMDSDGLSGIWDLNDVSDCGEPNCRIISKFSLEREIPYFNDPQISLRKDTISERKQETEKLLSLIADIPSDQIGNLRGIIPRLLRLILLALSALTLLALLALVHLYF